MCRRRCTDPLTRCLECEQEYLAWLEDQHKFDRLCQSDPRLDPTHQPATDREYSEYLDRIAPVLTIAVADQARNYS